MRNNGNGPPCRAHAVMIVALPCPSALERRGCREHLLGGIVGGGPRRSARTPRGEHRTGSGLLGRLLASIKTRASPGRRLGRGCRVSDVRRTEPDLELQRSYVDLSLDLEKLVRSRRPVRRQSAGQRPAHNESGVVADTTVFLPPPPQRSQLIHSGGRQRLFDDKLIVGSQDGSDLRLHHVTGRCRSRTRVCRPHPHSG